MEFNYVANIVDKVPYISKTNANYIYDFIIENKIQNILELGIAHGTATCYMAAALNKLGAGKITAVDLQSVAKDFKPSCEEQLKNNCNKFLIYGYGSMAKIIESLMPKQITGFIDLNYDKLNNEKVFSIENGLKKDFDFILISILGREEEVIDSLINEYSIQKDKIIKLI